MFDLNPARQRDYCHQLTQAFHTSKISQYTSLSLPDYIPANDKIAEFHASTASIRTLFGGNRSGKTESGTWELLQICQEPDTIVWACTVNNEMLGTVLAKKLFKYLDPADIVDIAWINKRQRIPRQINLRNGSQIHCKSYEQGREAFQGTSIRRCWLDEECPKDIFEECQARVIDQEGDILLTLTPLKGMTWVWDDIHEADDPNIENWTISLLENKYISQTAKDWFVSRLTQDEIEKRVHGRFMRLVGAVWKEFDPAINIIPRFPIPHPWHKIRSIDFGYVNPFCCLWVAQGEDNDYYVYQEYYRSETLLQDHAQAIKDLDAWGLTDYGCNLPEFEANVADHDAQDRAEFENYGIRTIPAEKDVQVGIQTVNRLFKKRSNGKPSLYIFDDLVHTITETKNYHYEPQRKDKNAPEQPAKINDHTQDALRYACMYFYEGTALDFNLDGLMGAEPMIDLG